MALKTSGQMLYKVGLLNKAEPSNFLNQNVKR